MHDALREIIEILMDIPTPSRKDLNKLKMQISSKHKLGKIPSNSEIIHLLKNKEKHKLLPLLRRKTTRTISGVTVIAVMTEPYPCPQSEPCSYCPGGPPFGVPQSYTGFEPAAMRGLQNKFDPHLQVKSRIEQLQAIGHNVDKIELIIMGGTFPATPLEYQSSFIRRCLDAITDTSSSHIDYKAFKRVFTNPDFKPDMIKIYPCLVLKDTKAYKWYLEGKYKPYTNEIAANLIIRIKKIIPRWIRIMRVQRDIPAPLIVAGVKRSNLRQLVQSRLKEQNIRCGCIRCREVGHRMLKDKVQPDLREVKTLLTKYDASEGEEIFISAEDPKKDLLIGYLRLRIPSEKAHRSEAKEMKCSIIRELHVYGPLVPVGKHLPEAWQHKGFGNILLRNAERISKRDYDAKKILVTSALGTKKYYMRFGYKYDGSYMSKTLEK